MTALVALVLLLTPPESTTGSLTGMVTAAADGTPVAGANVLLAGTQRGTTTSADGRFLLSRIAPDRYDITVSLIGYRRATLAGVAVTAGETTHVRIALESLPVQSEPVVVTAGRREQSLQEVPVSVTTMDGDALRFRNTVSLDEAVKYIPGVNMTEYQVNIRGSSGYSRGAGSRVLLLVDGVPLLTGDTEEINFESIPLGRVERVEVVKGASSALYGSSALGGVINVLTRPIPDRPTLHVSLSGGLSDAPSFAGWEWADAPRLYDRQSASASVRSGAAGMLIHAARMADDGYRQNDYRRRYNLYARTDLDLSTFERLSFTGNLMHQRRGSFLYWKDLRNALVPPDVQQGDEVVSTRFFFTGAYRRSLSKDLLLTAQALWFRNGWDDTIDTLTNTSRSHVLRAATHATWSPDGRNIITGGIEGSLERVRADLFGRRMGGGLGVFLQDELRIRDGVTVTLGVRYDWYDRDSLDPSGQVNPKAGVVWTLVPGTALRASVGRGFRVPSVAEAFVTTEAGGLQVIPNPGLTPERSVSWEAGVSQMLGDVGLLDVAAFQSDFWDLIEPRFVDVAGELKGQFTNVTRARVRGVEAVLRTAHFSRVLFLDVGYTVLRPRDLTLDDVLKYRPEHLVYVSALLHAGPVALGADARHLSRVARIDDEFRLFVKDVDARVPITVVDVSARSAFPLAGGTITVGGTIKNLFQYNYVELVGNLAPPRTFVVTLEGSW